MKVTIRYFASIREAVGRSVETMDTNALSLGALRDELIGRGDAWAETLAHGRAVRVALNQVMTDEGALLQDGIEVAFFPPVTGG